MEIESKVDIYFSEKEKLLLLVSKVMATRSSTTLTITVEGAPDGFICFKNAPGIETKTCKDVAGAIKTILTSVPVNEAETSELWNIFKRVMTSVTVTKE